MTREEAYEIIEEVRNKICSRKYATEQSEAFDIALELLKQEPCEDTISRQAAKKALEDRFMELQKRHSADRYETNFCLNTILELPLVSPQPKMGR